MAEPASCPIAQPVPRTSISVIVPVYQEEAGIREFLEHLRELGPDEIIVVDGSSADRTAEIADRYASVLITPLGRAVQMNAGAVAATGDVLLFLHADVRLRKSALDIIRRKMADSTCCGGNFDIRFDGNDAAAHIFTLINRWRRRCGIFYGDSGIFCRREIFEQFGGYKPWPILEDYEFARCLWKLGKLSLLEEPIRVSDRRWTNGGLWSTLWSWFWIQALYLAGVSPHRLAKLYRHTR